MPSVAFTGVTLKVSLLQIVFDCDCVILGLGLTVTVNV